MVLPPLLVFGPDKTVIYHRQWWEHNVGGAAAQGMVEEDLQEHFVDRRNQSIATVIARLCWPEHPFAVDPQPVRLSREGCLRIALTVTVALALMLAAFTRRPWSVLPVEMRRREFAAYCIAMLVLSPLLRQYYLAWVLPAVVLFCQAAWRGENARERFQGNLGLLIWLIGMALWTWQPARLYGAHLYVLVALGVLLLIQNQRADEGAKTPDRLEAAGTT
jgi:hypothetical protein